VVSEIPKRIRYAAVWPKQRLLESKDKDLTIFDLIFAQQADQLPAEPALRGAGGAFHKEHDL
jgi:hypothetical protein